jgi:hypothetical protein
MSVKNSNIPEGPAKPSAPDVSTLLFSVVTKECDFQFTFVLAPHSTS